MIFEKYVLNFILRDLTYASININIQRNQNWARHVAIGKHTAKVMRCSTGNARLHDELCSQGIKLINSLHKFKEKCLIIL